jgi:hypothetical protein
MAHTERCGPMFTERWPSRNCLCSLWALAAFLRYGLGKQEGEKIDANYIPVGTDMMPCS